MPKDQAYLEAEKKIQEALQSGATELDLSQGYFVKVKAKLSELPPSSVSFQLRLKPLTKDHLNVICSTK